MPDAFPLHPPFAVRRQQAYDFVLSVRRP
ncbi:hypothetical protein DF3PA_70093 [Candidatus Defluviicoccus seviourii]|uniref:Uncharacterized protein n=2 Tax=root TaxID=1 RepID=A0A564WH63_9PROT|nr:hypothetical protein DF3PB_1880008 [uncultured Defluviicoccus sp.]VUX47772.1 hypothetical protein DF3PA_70093 [Candidatus Defluviicoccus seviourii]